MKHFAKIFLMFGAAILVACATITKDDPRIKIIIDSDANNELDDQHALAYAFLNPDVFNVVGITVNNTQNGAGIKGQYDEAERILKLFNLNDQIPLLMGADKNYDAIVSNIQQDDFDGKAAVDFIISQAHKTKGKKLVLAPIGKLTNIALALKRDPSIVDKVKVVWLGGHYPEPGEYNLENDTSAVNPVIASGVEFEMVTVRYDQPTGSGAVVVTRKEIRENMKASGPKATEAVIGRDGETYACFGDYSVALFENGTMYGRHRNRALFDMVVLAILKNESWGQKTMIPAPRLQENAWQKVETTDSIALWENFNRDAIVNDLFELMRAQ